MQDHKHPSELTSSGIFTVLGSTVGLALGPSVILILSVGPFITPIEQEFGWSRVEVSLAITIASYMILFASPIQGFLVDRFGPRRVVLTSIPLFALGLSALYLLPDDLRVFYLLFAMLPFLGVGLWPLSYLQAVTYWFDRKLGLALGCANAGIGVGSMLVPLVITALIVAYDWRTAFLGLGILVLCISWPVVFFGLREPTKAAKEAVSKEAKVVPGLSFRESTREPSFYILIVAFFLLGVTATSLVTQQVPLLIEAGWTPTEAAFIQSVFGLSLLAARVFVGYVIDHVFAPRVMLTVSIGGALACVLYAVFPNAAVLSAVLLGFLLGAEFDVLAFLIKRYFGNIAYGRLYGVIFGLFYLGSGLGVAGLSMSRQIFGNYSAGLFIAAGILLACAVLVSFLPQYRYRPYAGVPSLEPQTQAA